ncbi:MULTISPECIES: hypothetical protein [Micromonospora]|uniref:Beta-lactamase enzyme family protein n=1 Tax=Micromonospora yangpuensis TaxID=683228 RepID=A0A1C6TZS1_9ACTN|nr:hypothetical protein [Micromonospora yangpuensis]GGM21108.1 hypothetical protein GCM10012279_44350 [Micromonospora yangpuensis]SCL47121.1 hypothetical protein GA0070617_0483 [Micromonospora yangpuensis]
MRPRVIMVLAVAAILLGGVMLVPTAYAKLAGDDDTEGSGGGTQSVATPEPTAPPPPTLAAGPVTVSFKGDFFSWALLDRETGEIAGAKNKASTSSTESMIKAWFAAAYLKDLGDKPVPANFRRHIVEAIRDSNDDAANTLYNEVGGAGTIRRMVQTCKLTDTKPGKVPGYVGWWSFTEMSARDAVRLGDCLADGTAAGPKHTEFLLAEMAKVRGSTAAKDQKAREGGGRWGIIDGLPDSILDQGPVSMKNGWTPLNYDGNWHVNCLAVTEKWSLAVLLRYPQKRGLNYGAQTCATVASQLVTPQPGAALKVPQHQVGKL